MKKIILLFFILLFCLFFSSCQNETPIHEHDWSEWYDNGDGTHLRICRSDVKHREIEEHRYDEGLILEKVDDDLCGKIKYICLDCGYSEIKALYSEGNHIFDKKIIEKKYLYQTVSEYSAIYYLSCECGLYGDESKLFEYNMLSDEYTLLANVNSDGTQYVDIGLSNDGSYYINYVKTSADCLLPAEYTEVEYIEATGTQCIDTGCYFDANTDGFEVTFQSTVNQQCGMILANYDCTSSEDVLLYHYAQEGVIGVWIEHQTMQVRTGFIEMDEEKHTAKYENKTLFMDDEYCGEEDRTVDKTQSPLFLCNWHSDSGNSYPYIGRIYSCKITHNGEIVRDFVPCVNGSGEVGLFDIVGSKFYANDGEGAFKSGPVVYKNSDSRLPEGYKKVQYIESTGTQYIDTGIAPDSDYEWRFVNTLSFNTTEPDYQIFGFSGNQGSGFGANENTWWHGPDKEIIEGEKYTVEYYRKNGMNYTSVDGERTDISYDGNISITENFLLFAIYLSYDTKEIGEYCYSRLFESKIYREETCVREFIPCISPTGEVGLYDLIEGKFYGNKGSGVFLYGYTETNGGNNISYSKLNYSLPQPYHEVSSLMPVEKTSIDTGVLSASSQISLRFSIAGAGEQTLFSIGENCYVKVSDYKIQYGFLSSIEGQIEDILKIGDKPVLLEPNAVYRLVIGINATSNGISNTLCLPMIVGNGTDSLVLFGNLGNTAESYITTFYGMEIRENDVVVAEYLPAIKTDGNEVGLYDTVTERFMRFEANTKRGMLDNTASLLNTEIAFIEIDDRYTKRDYIESTGKEYIDTRISYDAGKRLKFAYEISYSNITSTPEFMGFSDVDYYFIGRNGKNQFVGTPNIVMKSNRVYGVAYSYEGNKAYYTFEGNTYESDLRVPLKKESFFTLFAVFNRLDDISTYSKNCRIYSFKVYDNDCLVHYYIPATDNVTKENGLYDALTGDFLSSATESNLLCGDDPVKSIDDSFINLFYFNNGSVCYLQTKSIAFVSVKEENGAEVRRLIPVIRNKDMNVGFYDIIHGEFYSSAGSPLIAGEILGHLYDDGVITKPATYCEDGEKVYTCSLCGNKMHEPLKKTSYRVDFVAQDGIQVKVFFDKGENDYSVANVAYTRNTNSLNYSKIGASVVFEVDTDSDYVLIPSNGSLETIGENRYCLLNVSDDCQISCIPK